ncbi:MULTISPECIES: 16S rRNA (cytosine(1402)-N(4))-methyltransferase RsmH [Streptomyces]|uniref:Ribosomal RNA small subunit methyltransferase H n=1 Tax=Streptomyces tsukubensis (strain DSM 42081 / NBRC 108919 / NRRL 18488 / 9993) TaxID=1114943 RepID=A0A7G3UJR8_STRT9|nr:MULTISPECIES: 16S rRNA (cytosine(1402)-N(4))-methyltransferase RsmH [Streptomyces]AZK93656.1 16S rRNA (cytosine(1402)-N(4))-methyltransferase [Streptomyces tsukubensis]MYS63624.1 16S rRNA (cytosine(1402)-N(4))-methyltransferase RsmH [Streptomyces sp. SID5473]QKM70198.1 16S rRNA (cytosine(1402)-N(4))-methyltransferase RsmH [Streptomyces tsukubensis NRRL18488]TAI45822.1 16S rRNA (cytosine(1402)-N(4))-methyltransferase RsmH [Streptomyces tsukubensis]
MSNTRHVPVMLQRCLDLLAPALEAAGDREAVVVDCTLGLGGHSEALLSRFPAVRLIALDRDPEALRLSAERLAPFGDRAVLVHAVYDELPEVLERLGVPEVQGVLFDLGVSSMQLDEADRGFAYAQDAPLDMRMDQTTGVSAAEVLNTYAPGELVRILRMYGEEKQAKRIVSAIVRERDREPFTTSARLVQLIRDALPQAAKRTGGNPAKRTFQALRIEVNGELSVLERAVPAAVGALAVGGRIAVLSYHSLEDRLVKQVLAAGAATTAPPGLPVVPEEYQPRLKLLTRGAELPTEEEVAENRRAAPARLRGAERIRKDVR